MAACQPANSISYPAEMVLQEHAKYVVFIKELQTEVRTLQDFRSRVLQAFPHLDIGLYCSMALSKLSSKRQVKIGGSSSTTNKILPILPGLAEYADVTGHFQMKQTKHVQKKTIGIHTQPRKLAERSLGSGFRTKTKRSRSIYRGKKCTEFAAGHIKENEVDEDECDMSNETSTCTSNSFHSMTNQRNAKGKCVKAKLDGTTTCVAHRQDSGFSTDGKDKAANRLIEESEIRPWPKSEDQEDELMNILDIIEQRSVTMRSLVEKGPAYVDGADMMKDLDFKTEDLVAEVDRLQFEKEILVERLLGVEMEQKLYKDEINRLKDSLIEAEVSKRILEDRLDAAISEREQLGTRINRLHTKFVTKSTAGVCFNQNADSSVGIRDATKLFQGVSTSSSCIDGPNSLPDRLGRPVSKLKVRMDKAKVSAILQESRTLELQRQLLVSVIRNEVVKCRVEHQEKEWNQRAAKWQQFEIQWQKDVEALKRLNNELQIKIQKVSTELRLERSKRKVLERALHAAYRDLTNVNNCTGSSGEVAMNIDEYSKEISFSSKQKHDVSQHCTDNGCGIQKSPLENYGRSRDPNLGKVDDRDVCHSCTQHGDAAIGRNKRCQSGVRKQTLVGSSHNLQDAVLQSGHSAQLLNATTPIHYVPTCNHVTPDQLGSQWKWSYRVGTIPDGKVTS